MNKIWPIIFTSGALLLSGCAGNIKLTDYSMRQLPPTNPLPTKEEINAERTRVVIFEPEIKGNKIATQAKLDDSIVVALDEHISTTSTEIIDRSIAKKLKKELELAEIKGKGTYTGPNIADYAITGKITEANLASRFVAASQRQNDKGEIRTTPAECKFTANVKTSLRIYKLPALQYLKTVIAEDIEHLSKDPEGTNCVLPQNEKDILFRVSASEAVKKSRDEFQNFFARKGFVLERRVKEDDSIFKISRGKADGFNPDDTVKLYHLDTSPNPLTGEPNAHEYELVTGTISNLAGDDHAWVLVEDKNAADQVKLGDYAKVFFEIGTLETTMDYYERFKGVIDQVTEFADKAAGGKTPAATDFSGVWEGRGTQYGSNSSWSIKVAKVGNEYTIEYPSLNCGGTLALLSSSPNRLEFQETLTFGLSACVNNGKTVIERINGNTAKYKWYYSNGKEGASGTLARKNQRGQAQLNESAGNSPTTQSGGGKKIRIAKASASSKRGRNGAPLIIDGNPSTFWQSENKVTSAQSIKLSLYGSETVNQLHISIPEYRHGFPPRSVTVFFDNGSSQKFSMNGQWGKQRISISPVKTATVEVEFGDMIKPSPSRSYSFLQVSEIELFGQ